MKLGTQLKKLHDRIKVERMYKTNLTNTTQIEDIIKINKIMKFQKSDIKSLEEHLAFLQNLLSMIRNGATGFDLAHEVEKNKEVKKLIYDGILFYNTFIEIGNTRFMDAPDKKKIDYEVFRTVEDTEKFIFLVWLRETINSIEKEFKPKGDYAKYLEIKKQNELREKLTHCKNCGEPIRSIEQDFCEKCGFQFV